MNLKTDETFYDQSGGKRYRVLSQLQSYRGNSYQVEEEQTKNKFTLKIQSKRTQQELSVLELLVKKKFSNLVNTLSFGDYKSEYHYSIMEYCQENLYETITSKGTITNEQFRYVALQIATGLKELHELGLIHRDIKPENIMQFFHVDQQTKKVQKTYKISDFSLISNQREAQPQNQGTPYYLAPEQINAQINYTNKVNIWALGTVFYEMVRGQLLFLARVQEDIYKLIKNSPIDKKIEELNLKPKYQKLIKDMLNRDPDKRLDIDSVLQVLKPQLNLTKQNRIFSDQKYDKWFPIIQIRSLTSQNKNMMQQKSQEIPSKQPIINYFQSPKSITHYPKFQVEPLMPNLTYIQTQPSQTT